MKIIQILDYDEADNTAVVLTYEAPDDFTPPLDWHKLPLEGFMPDVPTDMTVIDSNIATVGVLMTEIDDS